jgi:membrane protein
MTGSDSTHHEGAHRYLLLEAGSEFMEDRALRLGAGLAYYGLITLAPLLILLLGIAGLILGEEAANGQLTETLQQWFGADIAQAFAEMITAADVAGTFANLTIASLILLIFAASILFVAWKDALNVIWGIGYHSGVKATLAKRLFGFASVGALAGLLVAILVAETLIAMLSGLLSDDALIDAAFGIAASIVPLVLGALLLGAAYRFGTDGKVAWRAVWPGTILTMVLLIVLAAGYGIYVDLSGTSITGVASSAILLIVLVYLMAQVMLYGGEVIKVQSRRARY